MLGRGGTDAGSPAGTLRPDHEGLMHPMHPQKISILDKALIEVEKLFCLAVRETGKDFFGMQHICIDWKLLLSRWYKKSDKNLLGFKRLRFFLKFKKCPRLQRQRKVLDSNKALGLDYYARRTDNTRFLYAESLEPWTFLKLKDKSQPFTWEEKPRLRNLEHMQSVGRENEGTLYQFSPVKPPEAGPIHLLLPGSRPTSKRFN